MNKAPFFSIVIPVFNVEPFLNECLDSVIGQTFEDIEIICINDGSTDRSPEILESYQERDRKITTIHKNNCGLSSARNTGLNIAKGRFICFVDADDYIERNFCERLYGVVQQYHPDIIVFGAKLLPLSPSPPYWLKKALTTRNKHYESFIPDVLFTEPGCRPFICRNCYKLSFLNKHNLRFEEEIRFGEDQIFQFMAFPRASRFTFIEDKLYHYRWFREGSLMSIHEKDKEEKYRQHIYMVKYIRDRWKETGDLERMAEHFFRWSIDFLGYDLISSTLPDKRVYAREIAQIWQCLDLTAFRKKLTQSQIDILNYITLGRMSFWSKIRKTVMFRNLSGLFRCLKQHGLRYTAQLVLEHLKMR